MDFESIIWIVVFLIYIASVMVKRIRRASKTEEKEATKTYSGWKEKLTKFKSQVQGKFGDFMNDIKQEMEAAKQKEAKKETGWEKFLPPKTEATDLSAEPTPKDNEKDVTLLDAEPTRRDLFYQKKAQPLKTVPPLKPKPPVEKVIAEKKEPLDSEKKIREKELPYGIRDLRRAIIWSEILAPPIALRDE